MGKMYDALQKMEREKHPVLKEDASKALPEDVVFDDKVVSFFDPYSMAAEQFRRLKTYVIRLGIEHSIKTILVTSAMAGEGKSFVAINLAVTIAVEMNSHVLVVDCDLRDPSFTQWFGFQEKYGLSDYLAGKAELPDLLVKTPLNKLTILPAGSFQENPVELVGSDRMKDLVSELKTRYADRYIIFDSSPLLATTEPSIVDKMVDGTLLVVKSGVTPRESVLQALKLLDREKIIGVALNSLEFKTQAVIRRYFGSDNNYYGYHYGISHREPAGLKSFFKKILSSDKKRR